MNKRIMKSLKAILLIFLPLVLLLVFMSISDPYEVPLVVLLIPFALLFWFVYKLIDRLLRIFSLSKNKEITSELAAQQVRQRHLIAGTLAAVVVLVTVLQSIQQLTLRDILISLALLFVTIFYVRKLH